ncbi:putative transporter, permease component [Deinococcus aerius]|uniref:Putative transporter, permease component n=1 Tax=Deinococcus aerius TaxID=200253 RepID=A0A2I9CZK1_9DEIO|nr:MFS transporter [Deinococcus aerius]GBF07664.1 putative transporter, permease component [Deinococcus aerius]
MPPQTLWNRSFILWLVASGQSQLGSALASIALSFLVLHQTGSAGQMALTLACALAPNLLMPFAGALVDRVNLKLPLIGADVARGVLQLVVGGLALAWGEVPLWVVNGAALLTGFAGIFANPASSAAVPSLVPPAELARANGLLGGVGQGAWLIGTLAGGWIVSVFSPPVAIVVDGLSFFVMAALLLAVRLPGRAQPSGPRPSVLADVASGLRLMRRSRVLTLVPFIGLVLNATLAPVTVVTPKLMETLGAGAKGYGLFLALESAGMLLSGALIAVLGNRLPPRRATAAGLALTALIYGVMWLRPTVPVLLVCSVILGFGFGILNTPLNTLMQRMVPAEYLGRVFSVLGTVSTLGMPLSLLLLSPLLDRVALALWFGVASVLMLAGAFAWTLVALSERVAPDLHAAAAVPREVTTAAD